MLVSKQKQNANKEVARLASDIVAKWKKIVTADKAKKLTGSSPPKNTSSPAPTNEPKAFKGDVSKRRWDSENVDVKRTGVPTRDACIGLLYNGLAFMSKESSTTLIIKAMEVEQAAHTEFGGESGEYRTKLRSLFQNLKNTSNRELGPRVMSGEIPAARFVIMTHDELKSAERQKEDEKLEKENLKNSQVPMAERSISDALQCGKCLEKKVAYSQAQTRSADEPMTTFCECTNCGNRWKVHNLQCAVTAFANRYSSPKLPAGCTCVTILHFFGHHLWMDWGLWSAFGDERLCIHSMEDQEQRRFRQGFLKSVFLALCAEYNPLALAACLRHARDAWHPLLVPEGLRRRRVPIISLITA
jgi:transcription elongation factor S-II